MPNIASNVQFQQRAFAQDLDALSSVPARWRRCCRSIPRLGSSFWLCRRSTCRQVSCEDVIVFDVSSYYQALTRHGVALIHGK